MLVGGWFGDSGWLGLWEVVGGVGGVFVVLFWMVWMRV
jgi:hypothetical protein